MYIDEQFSLKVVSFLEKAREMRKTIRLLEFNRSPQRQARLFVNVVKDSAAITTARRTLIQAGAPDLARYLKRAERRHGASLAEETLATELPGASWHQWGQAVDIQICPCDFDVIGALLRRSGLNWRTVRPGFLHVQGPEARVTQMESWADINAFMVLHYGR